MSQLVRLQVEGPREEVEPVLRQLRNAVRVNERMAVIWLPPSWEAEGTEDDALEGTVQVEVPGRDRWLDAHHQVQQAVERVDPARSVVKGGDIDKWKLPL